jgi:hypothetical protein
VTEKQKPKKVVTKTEETKKEEVASEDAEE